MHPQFVESSVTFVMAAMLAAHSLARSDRSHSTRGVVALMVSLMIWTGGVALARVDADPARAYAWSCVAFGGAALVPPAWTWLALSFTERVRLIGAGLTAAWIFAPSGLMIAALATNPLHHGLIAHPELLIDHGADAWGGPLFWPWIAWAWLLVVFGTGLYVRASLRLMEGPARTRAIVMFAASILPLASSIVYTIGALPRTWDRTPLLLGISTVLLYAFDWRFRLLDTMPIARRDVIDQLDDGVIVADPDGLIVHMNAAAERLIQVRLADVAGQSLARMLEVQSADHVDFDHEGFARLVRSMCARPSGFERVVENRQGRVYEIRGSSVTDVEGDVAGLYLILRDRTEASRYDAVLQQIRRSEAVTGLAAGIAHEVNNPLAYVRANVTHLLGLLPKDVDGALELESGGDVRDVLQESLEGIDRIGTIVERLQRLSTPQPSVARPFEVDRVVGDAVRASGLEGSAHVALAVSLSSGDRPANGHRDGLLQALVEILENAERAIGQRAGRVEVGTLRRDEEIEIVVDDDGPGVPRALRERVFDPFFTTRDDEPGSGLGLAMASKAVGDLGGSIELTDSPLGGAQVVIRLPLDRAKRRR